MNQEDGYRERRPVSLDSSRPEDTPRSRYGQVKNSNISQWWIIDQYFLDGFTVYKEYWKLVIINYDLFYYSDTNSGAGLYSLWVRTDDQASLQPFDIRIA